MMVYLPDGEAVTLLPDVRESLGRLIREKLGPDAELVYNTLLEDLDDRIDDLEAEIADHDVRHVDCPNCGAQVDLED